MTGCIFKDYHQFYPALHSFPLPSRESNQSTYDVFDSFSLVNPATLDRSICLGSRKLPRSLNTCMWRAPTSISTAMVCVTRLAFGLRKGWIVTLHYQLATAIQVRVLLTAPPHLRANIPNQAILHHRPLNRTGTLPLRRKFRMVARLILPLRNRTANPRLQVMAPLPAPALNPLRVTLLPRRPAVLGMEHHRLAYRRRLRTSLLHFLLGGPSTGTRTVVVLITLRSRAGEQNGFCLSSTILR